MMEGSQKIVFSPKLLVREKYSEILMRNECREDAELRKSSYILLLCV